MARMSAEQIRAKLAASSKNAEVLGKKLAALEAEAARKAAYAPVMVANREVSRLRKLLSAALKGRRDALHRRGSDLAAMWTPTVANIEVALRDAQHAASLALSVYLARHGSDVAK